MLGQRQRGDILGQVISHSEMVVTIHVSSISCYHPQLRHSRGQPAQGSAAGDLVLMGGDLIFRIWTQIILRQSNPTLRFELNNSTRICQNGGASIKVAQKTLLAFCWTDRLKCAHPCPFNLDCQQHQQSCGNVSDRLSNKVHTYRLIIISTFSFDKATAFQKRLPLILRATCLLFRLK
ncbi:hypothetical protein K501DRAFT_279927 [Backusella circina FSU 941]|nr:hypothetical protein K501DRAFT_279927 [Backusella circina FSU 941]